MVPEAEALSVLTAAALSVSAPLGKTLSTWSHHRMRSAESFAAGASLAYVIIDLMIELTGKGAAYVHATLPIGPSEERSLFSVVLIGAAWWYLVGALAAKMKKGQLQARYLAYVAPHGIYCLFVGGALALESQFGIISLMLFALPILLHLTILESHMQHEFEGYHKGIGRVLLAVAPALGAIGWALLGFSNVTLFIALALVAGSTVVQVIQTELPSPDLVRIGPFLIGLAVYTATIGARWARAF